MGLGAPYTRQLTGTAIGNDLGDMSATFNSKQHTVQGRQLSIHAAWSGTPTGTFKLQSSFDGGTTWIDTPGAAAEFTANGNAQPAGSASGALWNFINVPGTTWRLVYTRSSGSGTLTSYYAQQE